MSWLPRSALKSPSGRHRSPPPDGRRGWPWSPPPPTRPASGTCDRWPGRQPGLPAFAPATAAAVLALLDHHEVALSGRRAVVVGRSAAVGKPVAQLLLARDTTVTVCHSRTRDLAAVTSAAEVLVVAAGRPGLIGPGFVAPGAVVAAGALGT